MIPLPPPDNPPAPPPPPPPLLPPHPTLPLSLFNPVLAEPFRESSISDLRDAARFYFERKDKQLSLTLFLLIFHLCEADPDFGSILASDYIWTSSILIEHKEIDLAIDHLGSAIALKPTYSRAFADRGYCYIELKRFDLAIRDYSKSLNWQHEYIEAFRGRAYARLELKDFEGALEDYRRAVMIGDKLSLKNGTSIDECKAYNGIGFTLNCMKDHAGAIEAYLTALEVNSDFPEARCNLAHSYQCVGNWDLALRNYNEGIDCCRDRVLDENRKDALSCLIARSLMRRGFVLYRLGFAEEARQDWIESVTLSPEMTRIEEYLELFEGVTDEVMEGIRTSETFLDELDRLQLFVENFVTQKNSKFWMEERVQNISAWVFFGIRITVFVSEVQLVSRSTMRKTRDLLGFHSLLDV